MSDLYIIQNHLGLIKVGQSENVAKRKTRIERDDICHASIIFVGKNKGCNEQSMLRNLRPSQLVGEWHDGDDETRCEIAQILKLETLPWQFELADDLCIDEWIDRIEKRREMISHEKLTQRFITKMVNFYDSVLEMESRFCDFKIGQIIYEYDLGQNYLIMPATCDGSIFFFSEAEGPDVLLSKYTTCLEDALKIFPSHQKPNYWEGTIWECCIDGLKARRQNMIERHKALLTDWQA